MVLFSSKYCNAGFVWDFFSANPERSVERLVNIARKVGKSVLVPTSDAAAVFVASHSDKLREWFWFPLLSPALARSLCNKKKMFFLAKSLGVPTPNTFFPESRDEALRFSKEARFPIIIKPIETNGHSVQKAIVDSAEALIANYDLMDNNGTPRSSRLQRTEAPTLMLQEYIPGGEEANWMFNGYFDAKSRCLFGVTGRKIRQHRPYAGVTSLGACVTNQRLSEITIRWMAAIGYRGILDIGYRYDARDDLYKVFDVNPRLGCTFRLFVSDNGMDVARAQYLDLTGQSVGAGQSLEGRRWLVEDLDIMSSFYYWREGKLSFKEWLNSFRGLEESAFFAWDDLKPVIRVVMEDAGRVFRRSHMAASERDLRELSQPAAQPLARSSIGN
jgi:D-aspartate ligase